LSGPRLIVIVVFPCDKAVYCRCSVRPLIAFSRHRSVRAKWLCIIHCSVSTEGLWPTLKKSSDVQTASNSRSGLPLLWSTVEARTSVERQSLGHDGRYW